MRRRAEIRVESRLEADPEAVWERMMSAEGINDEMAPFFRMTVPRGLDGLDLDRVEPGRLGRSWILLFGIPFALVPLLIIASRREVMGAMVNRRWLTAFAGVLAAMIIALNVFLLQQVFFG